MASEDGFETHSLIDALAADPYRFDFYHAVRSLEALHPGSPRVGSSQRVADDPVRFDRPELDRFAVYIATLIGLGTPHLRNRDEAPDLAKLHYSGRLAASTKNAEGLRAILEDYFKVHVEIEQFVGHWLKLPEDCQCRLGESRFTGLLGSTAIVGSKIWECQQRFKIRMGPMGFADYQRLLPSGRSIR